MKSPFLILLLVSVGVARASGAPPADVWNRLDGQAKELAADVQARDVHAIHKLDYAVRAETADLRQAEPALPADRKQKLDALLADIAKQASRAHHDGHRQKWADAAEARRQFVADLDEAEAIAGIHSSP